MVAAGVAAAQEKQRRRGPLGNRHVLEWVEGKGSEVGEGEEGSGVTGARGAVWHEISRAAYSPAKGGSWVGETKTVTPTASSLLALPRAPGARRGLAAAEARVVTSHRSDREWRLAFQHAAEFYFSDDGEKLCV